MSLSLKTYINNIRKKPPYPNYKSHHWADYIELLCLVNIDNEISKADIIDRLVGRQEDLHEGDIDEIEENKELEEEDQYISTKRSQKSDNWDNEVRNWFLVLEHRISLYGGYYPFVLENTTLKLVNEELEKAQMAYIYLLFCSNLYLFQKGDMVSLTGSFELLSLQVLKNIMPSNAVVDLFGKNPLNKGIYSGSLWDKIHLLADNLHEKVNPMLSELDYPKSNTADDGLDLIGWVPSGDSLPSKHIIFGQCACSPENWVVKQHSSSDKSWSNKITLTTTVSNVIFIPFCFRNATGMWVNIGDIQKSFLIDRKRILHYLYDNFNPLEVLPSYSLVKKLFTAREGIF